MHLLSTKKMKIKYAIYRLLLLIEKQWAKAISNDYRLNIIANNVINYE